MIHDVATGEHTWYLCLRAGPYQNVTHRIEVDLVTEEAGARGMTYRHENSFAGQFAHRWWRHGSLSH